MSDVSILFDNDDEVFFSLAEQKEKKYSAKENEKSSTAIKIILGILFLCMLFEGVFYNFIRPSLQSPKVSVTGTNSYSAEDVVRMLGVLGAKNWFDFNVDSAVSVIASESGIDSVSVRKVFPDKIYINLKEREPVAMTFLNQNGRSVAVQIDKSGVLFPERTVISDVNTVPIISGLPVEHLTEGMRIPVKYRSLIEQISAIQKIGQKYFAAISEICVIPKEYGNYELMLIPSSSRIKVLTDRTLNEDALKYMMIVLDVVNSIESDVSEIDLRYGSVSYRKR